MGQLDLSVKLEFQPWLYIQLDRQWAEIVQIHSVTLILCRSSMKRHKDEFHNVPLVQLFLRPGMDMHTPKPKALHYENQFRIRTLRLTYRSHIMHIRYLD